MSELLLFYWKMWRPDALVNFTRYILIIQQKLVVLSVNCTATIDTNPNPNPNLDPDPNLDQNP